MPKAPYRPLSAFLVVDATSQRKQIMAPSPEVAVGVFIRLHGENFPIVVWDPKLYDGRDGAPLYTAKS